MLPVHRRSTGIRSFKQPIKSHVIDDQPQDVVKRSSRKERLNNGGFPGNQTSTSSQHVTMITEDQQPDFRHIQHVAYWSMVAHGTMTHPVYRG
tara:strand:- start:107 stop:385 length:279 start_codon:yes stop_codon:yes gene_type:complete